MTTKERFALLTTENQQFVNDVVSILLRYPGCVERPEEFTIEQAKELVNKYKRGPGQ